MTAPERFKAEVDSFVDTVWHDVDRFLQQTGMAPTMFCKAAVNDPNLIRHIRQGRRRLTFNMAVRLRTFMDRHAESESPTQTAADERRP